MKDQWKEMVPNWNGSIAYAIRIARDCNDAYGSDDEYVN